MKKIFLLLAFWGIIQTLTIQVLKSQSTFLKYSDNGVETVHLNTPYEITEYHTPAALAVSENNEGVLYKYQIQDASSPTAQNLTTAEQFQRSHPKNKAGLDSKLKLSYLNDFKKAPYILYPGNNNEMLVMWQLNDTQSCQFSYGTDTTYSSATLNTTEYNNDHQHKITLTGLTNNQKYYYRVSTSNTTKYGSFQSAMADTAHDVTFFAYGDTRSNPGDHDNVAERIITDINQNSLSRTFIINSGDLFSNGNSNSSWDTEFFNQDYPNINYLLANLPYLAAMGNHEGQGILFEKYFPYPMFMNNRYYYSFDYGPVHITVLDQETNYTPGSLQYNWIVNDLSSTDKNWKIVVLHKPGWSAGGGHSNSGSVQNNLQPLFEQYGVSFVIAGHNHYYARAVVNGVEHVTTGGGGAPLYNPDNTFPNIVITDKSNHYCKLKITGNTLHFTVTRSNGTMIEEFDKQMTPIGITHSNLEKEWSVFSKEGKITVKTKSPTGKIEIYNDSGRQLVAQNIHSTETSFQLNNTGIYFIRYTENKKFSVKKLWVSNN